MVNQISEELKTPGLFHARIIAPVCNRVRPSSTLSLCSPPRPPKNSQKRPGDHLPLPPPPLPYFHLFHSSAILSAVASPLARYRVSDAKMAGRCEAETVSAFLKNAPTPERVCTYTRGEERGGKGRGRSISGLENA